MNGNTMTWKDMLDRLRVGSHEAFDYIRVEVNATYKEVDGKEIRVDFDYDALIIEFAGEFHGRYKPTVRIYKDSRVNATIEAYGYGYFSFLVTDPGEHFEQRLKITPGFAEYVLNQKLVDELRGIYEWIVSAYRSVE